MADDAPPQGGIDWTTASVDDAKLTVEISGDPGKKWRSRLQEIIERLERPGNPWGRVKITKSALSVQDVAPGGEADLRHVVESAVLQANAEFAPDEEDEDDGDEERSAEDREMTERFRAFSADADSDADESDESDDDED